MLGRFVPDFGKIVAMMQFNMYHHYTVDEHLIRAIGMLSDIEHGEAAEPHPLATAHHAGHPGPTRRSTSRCVPARHRQGPPRGPFASAGAQVAREALSALRPDRRPRPRPSLWLVEQHLHDVEHTPSRATSPTARPIATSPPSCRRSERMKLLLVLTVADIRARRAQASGTAGRASSCARSIMRPEPLLTGGFSAVRAQRVATAVISVGRWPIGRRRSAVSSSFIRPIGCGSICGRCGTPSSCALPRKAETRYLRLMPRR